MGKPLPSLCTRGRKLGLLDIDREGLEELKAEVKALGSEVVTATADLSTNGGVSEGIDNLLKAYDGQVDVLVNNVGRAPSGRSTSSVMKSGI